MHRPYFRSLVPAALLALALMLPGLASAGDVPAAGADYCNADFDLRACLRQARLPQNWRQIAAEVQAEVNKMPYRTDDVRYGRGEYWEQADVQGGDCEDYALEKLRRLVAAGFPIERLRLATVLVEPMGSFTRGNRNHVVLVIDAPDDQYILDNRFRTVVPIPALIGQLYTLRHIQRIGGSKQWVTWKFS